VPEVVPHAAPSESSAADSPRVRTWFRTRWLWQVRASAVNLINSSLCVRCVAVLLLCCACVTAGPLTQSEVRALATRTWNAPTDEVFDATWLTLRARGFEVPEFDRQAGTLTVTRDGRAWEIDVAALGSEQRVQLVPSTPVGRAELSQLLDALEEGTARLLAAWKELPEWKYDGRRNLLTSSGFTFAPPREWEWLDFDISRREVTVQRLRARTGLNATLLVEVDRTRPQTRRVESARRALGLALGARQRLVFPDELKEGPVRVLDGSTPQEALWFGLEETLGAVQVRLSLACPRAEEDACRALWNSIRASVIKPAASPL